MVIDPFYEILSSEKFDLVRPGMIYSGGLGRIITEGSGWETSFSDNYHHFPFESQGLWKL